MSETLVKFEEFLVIPTALFKSIGMDAYNKDIEPKRSYTSFFVLVLNLLNLVLVLFLEILFVYVSFKNNTDVEEAILNLSFIGFVMVCILKVMSVWRKKFKLTILMRELQTLYPKTLKTQKDFNVKAILQKSNRRGYPFAIFSYILVWCHNLRPLLTYFFFDYLFKMRDVNQVLPYYIYVPWHYPNHWSFFMLYAIENFAGHTTMAGQVGTDVMLFVVATQVIMHYKYLAKSIEEYKTGNASIGTKMSAIQDMKFLQQAISYHEKILNLSESMNDIFGVSLLFNFISSSLIICFLGFQITIDIRKDLLVIVISFLCCNLVQVFFISRYGHELILASESVGHAVYNHDWHNADLQYRKMLVFFIQRAQKTAILKATTFLNVSLEAMAELMQTSYKFFALLQTLYGE